MKKYKIKDLKNLGFVKSKVTSKQMERICQLYSYEINCSPEELSKSDIYLYIGDIRSNRCWFDIRYWSSDFEEIELVEDATFTNTQDLWKHLIAGGAIQHTITKEYIVKLEDGNLTPKGSFNFNTHPHQWHPHIKPKEWYEIDNKFTVCWVSNICVKPSIENHKTVAIVKYNGELGDNFMCTTMSVTYKFATPLTKEEIQAYLYR